MTKGNSLLEIEMGDRRLASIIRPFALFDFFKIIWMYYFIKKFFFNDKGVLGLWAE